MRRIVCALAAVGIVGTGVGCASKPVAGAERAVASALISSEEEERLGRQVHQQLEKEGMKLVTDPVVTQYIDNLSRNILRAGKRERGDVTWRLYVVDSPEVNAFATPGGNLYVNKGLIQAATSEAELAGVMAHEAGHVVGRHAARNMIQVYGLQAILGAALGQNPSMLKQIAAAIVANGAVLHHSRSQEIEADEYGARFSSAAGYDPNGLIAFFQTLQKKQGEMPQLLTWFSTHPATSERISNLRAYIQKHNLRGGQQNPVGQLSSIQQRLGPATGGGGQ